MSNADIFGIFKKAAKLTKDPNNGCRVVESQRHFALPPRYLGRLKKGAMESLESDIGRYSESLRAVPLAFSSLQLLQQAGQILDDQPYVHFNVAFKAVVFQPTIGSILKCVVNEFVGDHISCLVHNWFNLSLPLCGPSAEQTFPRGSKVTAKVTGIRAKNGILAIRATPAGKSLESLELQSNRDAATSQSSWGLAPKQKHDSGFASDDGLGVSLELQSSEDDSKTGKNKKKKKNESERAKEFQVEVKEEEHSEDVFDRTNGPGAPNSDRQSKHGNTWGEHKGDSEPTIEHDMLSTDVSQKKKKKKKRGDTYELESGIVIKEERVDLEEVILEEESDKGDDNGSLEQRRTVAIKKEPVDLTESLAAVESDATKKRKKKRKHGGDLDQPSVIVVKDEIMEVEESFSDMGSGKKKKKNKKRREDDVDCFEVKEIKVERDAIDDQIGAGDNVPTQEPESGLVIPEMDGVKEERVSYDGDGLKIKKKKQKRKGDNSVSGVIGSGDHSFRTTQEEVCGTIEESEGAPPKKKKKKHKMQWENS